MQKILGLGVSYLQSSLFGLVGWFPKRTKKNMGLADGWAFLQFFDLLPSFFHDELLLMGV